MKNITLYIDIAFCVLVLPIMALIFPFERWFHNFPWYMVAVVTWLYVVYIVNRSLTVPFLFKSNKYCLYGIALIVVSIAVTFLLSGINLYDPKPNVYDMGIKRILPSVLQHQQMVWSLFMIVEAFSFAVGLLTESNKQKSHIMEVEAQRDKAQLAQYKGQIKPHFMFNTLNSLYGLFLMNDSKALPSLEKYISMLRYVYSTSSKDIIPLSEEIEYIRQYVELQSLRLNDKTSVCLNIDVADKGLGIPPMLLVTLIENCFKHGVSSEENSYIDINLSEVKGRLSLSTKNKIFSHCDSKDESHTGISNCRKRLELSYPDRYKLNCNTEGDLYNVELNIYLAV